MICVFSHAPTVYYTYIANDLHLCVMYFMCCVFLHVKTLAPKRDFCRNFTITTNSNTYFSFLFWQTYNLCKLTYTHDIFFFT